LTAKNIDLIDGCQKKQKILSQWIDTIDQISNFLNRLSILSVKLLKFLTD
jgi:hypothetical protein